MGKNWKARDKKLKKKKFGMKISGRSLFTILNVQQKRAKKK
jgi:hypothetical protein